MIWGISTAAGPRSRRILLPALAIVSAVIGLLVGWLPATPAYSAAPCVGADCDVVTDPDGAQYVGTGGLLLPADSFTGTDADRTDAATCPECRWALLPMCRDGQAGGVACGGAATSCPPGEFRRIVLLLRPGDADWREVGLVCLVGGAPTTVGDVATRLSDVVVKDVPPLQPRSQPRGGTLIGLPAVFAAGQPATLGKRRFTLVGFEIVLDGRASWTWDFGDGKALTTDEPGGDWPDMTVSHAYSGAGSYPVSTRSTWEAWFTVDGLGPWPVGGEPVVQTAEPLQVSVVEARAELVVG
ncbi:MAG: PKD domain-containing protein [Actinomycetia bacterium]|nr:PKD domain-containing protein [Actinomycetes bacterium]